MNRAEAPHCSIVAGVLIIRIVAVALSVLSTVYLIATGAVSISTGTS
ncbi:MAG: hypothetical protein ACYCW5_05155 [Thermoleophilia bacterium]